MKNNTTKTTGINVLLEETKLLIWQLSIEIDIFMKGKDKETRWAEVAQYSEMLQIITDLFIGNSHSHKLILDDLLTLNVLTNEKTMRMELYSAIERFFLVLNQSIQAEKPKTNVK